ncbi:MAG: Mini-ribonuclease 3 [Clostridia bacterium]|nr:Mini-ribonuclease 3 [Clostridia bacterium]
MFDLQSVMTKEQAKGIHPVSLAFVGDAVFSLYVRKRLLATSCAKPSEYQKNASSLVSATEQSKFVEKLLPLFTEEETEIFKRGRNAKKNTKSKAASVGEYNRSTGFEAVVGFLYLTGDKARLNELFSLLDEQSFTVEKQATHFKP